MDPVVRTSQGQLRGAEHDGVLAFRGIPYAAPPTGPRRFRPPEPPERWDGVRDATAFASICPQPPMQLEQLAGTEPPPQDEDCLTLNVYTPGGDAALPVMVWIHGGAFVQGSGNTPWYEGWSFARNGIVLVTINYRLGPWGFLHTEELFGDAFGGSANAGLLDQIAALQWVQRNISAFGGDPANVTVFGESAGGMSVGTLLGCDLAHGLFTKAIAQSGAAHNVLEPATAARVTRALCAEAGITPGDAQALEEIPSERLLEAVGGVMMRSFGDPGELFGEDFAGVAMPFQPIRDGRTIDRRPIDGIAAGRARGIPTLCGTNAEEWRMFTAFAPERPEAEPRPPRPLRNLAERAGRSAEELVEAYRRARPGASAIAIREAVETDRVFRIPAIRLAEAQARNDTPAYMYLFTWRTPAFGGLLGSCHALEIPFVFDALDGPGMSLFLGEEPPRELARAMHGAWQAFARTGDPNHELLGEAWPAYDTERRATMVLGASIGVEEDPGAAERALWEGLW